MRIIVAIVAMIASILLPAHVPAPQAGGAGGTSAPQAAAPQVSLAFVTNNASDYWIMANKGTDAAIADLKKAGIDANVDFVIPTDGTAQTQTAQVDDLLARGVQGFAISPVDPNNQTQMIDNAEKKAHLITQDSDAPGSDRECYVGTDNVAAGVQAGQQILKALPNGGKIMLFVGKIDTENARDRYQGIQDALNNSKVQVLGVLEDDTDHTRAVSNVSDTLVKYPDIAGLVGLWSYNGPAIANAVKSAGKVGKVKIICFDQEEGTLASIRGGAITATIVQDPYHIGYQSIKMLAALVKGDKTVIPPNKILFIPTLVVNKSNVAAYTAQLHKMLGR